MYESTREKLVYFTKKVNLFTFVCATAVQSQLFSLAEFLKMALDPVQIVRNIHVHKTCCDITASLRYEEKSAEGEVFLNSQKIIQFLEPSLSGSENHHRS